MSVLEIFELVKLVVEFVFVIVSLIEAFVSTNNVKKSKIILSNCEDIKIQLENLNVKKWVWGLISNYLYK